VSCEKNPNKVARAAGQSGINPAGSKSGFTAGNTTQVSFFSWAGRESGARRRRKRSQKANKSNGRRAQISFFERDQAAGEPKEAPAWAGALPTQRQINISRDFSPEELDKLVVQLHLGEAATARHLRELKSGQSRGIGHSDPRPMDWAQSDQRQYRFLIEQVRRARRGNGAIDTASLKKNDLVELWEFARFEADRAHRNIDHLVSGLSHLKGPTAAYLAGGHQLEARFYSFLADQLEHIIPEEALVRENW
jgi:hypothetical protein